MPANLEADLPPRPIMLGVFASPHGVRGDILIRTFTSDPSAIASYGALSDKSGNRTFKIKIVRVTDKGVVARVDGVADRTAAERLTGTELYVDRRMLPPPAADEFYHSDLIGLGAVLDDGRTFGTVQSVANFGAGDLIEIKRHDNEATEYIAFSKANVPHIDFTKSVMTIVLPPMVGEPEPQSAENDLADPEDASSSDPG